jgi:hypothetical protein
MMGTMAMEPPSIYKAIAPPDAAITGRIHVIRGLKVMLDRDLAELYVVPVKVLKQAVRRNMERFPEDFMVELTLEEDRALRSQLVTLKQGGHAKYPPFAFTEHGILMLANVLRSERALAVSIHIIRVFARLREALSANHEILRKLEQLEGRLDGHDHLTALVSPTGQARKPIGFKPEVP